MLPDGRTPVLLTAHTEGLIAEDARRIGRFLQRGPRVDEVAATLLRIRRRSRHRVVVRAADVHELTDALRAVADGDEHALVTRSSDADARRCTFVFPGQGNQWPSMGAEAYRLLDAYRAEADACSAAFVAAGAPSPLTYLVGDAGGAEDWSQVAAQSAQFTHAAGLAAVWRDCGVTPELTVGHSLGEVAAAYAAGAITRADAAAVVIARATVLESLSEGYGMVVLGVGPDEAQSLIESIPGWLELAVVNADSSVAVSGERDAVAELLAAATARGIFARAVTMAFPAHTSLLDGLRDELSGRLPRSRFRETDIPFIGSATGAAVDHRTDFADYWFANLRNTVRFDRAAASAVQRGADVFIEMSAHPALLFALGQSADDALTVGSGRRDAPIVDTLSAGVAAVAAHDTGFPWAETVTTAAALPGFPNTPMREVHLWALPQPLPPPPLLTIATHQWEPHRPGTPGLALRRTAVVDLAGPRSDVSDLLRDAVARHRGMQSASASEADLVLAVAPALDGCDAVQAVAELTELIGADLLGYADTVGPDCRDVWLITVAAEQLDGDPAAPLPAQAAMAAMHRSIGFEYPDLTFRHLDLPSRTIDEGTAAAALDAALGDADELALRESDAGLTIFTRVEHEAVSMPESWVTDPGVLDSVVITGGSGTVGQHYARHLADRGARRILLLSRSGVIPDALADLPVHAVRCDITEPAQLAAAAAEFAGDGASLVIHAAATARFADHRDLTDADFLGTTAAKISGLARFAELWPLRADARMVVCSSVSGLWGGRGHAAYAAANRMLDVLAAQLRGAGIRCCAVRFGLFGTGIVDDEAVAKIGRSGLVPLEPDAAIEASLLDHPADPVIYSADQSRLQVFRAAPVPESPAPAAAAGDTTAVVLAELTAVLGIDSADVDLAASLLDIGVDSLLALDLRKRLRRATGRSVPLAAMLGGMTGTELIAGLDDTPQRNEIPA
ncbi:polyketide synthase [Mycolicibacterium duvalii]|uniref:Polyketide synthase n=1 Tax=Mycolicibacterium duvalii TaxID=39688 RepID=A0A7I7JX30_9MYCO|nr:mycobactin polyketide synthase MbtD [Mycolicibacterium duvalii]MCV7367022.1 mycobactin polyketide synthase MbtD [Mycolicibacterium duvalii]PEG40327.1 polyketide synthase [Mycolicibacterium duvalii]BBX15854.1 polyketide synthase [Mycolicibacterium duvalii]